MATFDVLALLCKKLSEATTLLTATEVPEKRPEKFITVYRDGGPRDQLFDSPIITVQTWAASDADAYQLALDVRAVIEGLANTSVPIRDVSQQSLRVNNYKDGTHRYEAVYYLTTNLSSLEATNG